MNARRSPSSRNPRLEDEIREMLRGGHPARAAHEAFRHYGPELFGFLVGVLDDRERAGTLYADACRQVEREVAAFGWTCTLRIWMYAVVRAQLRRHPPSSVRRQAPWPSSFELPAPIRTISRRPATRRADIAALRMRLAQEDRELLILRIDRSMDWLDIAFTTLGADAPRIALAAESNRLRARMRAVREELASRAHELTR